MIEKEDDECGGIKKEKIKEGKKRRKMTRKEYSK